jgi:ketosteroid isomerase-like protein
MKTAAVWMAMAASSVLIQSIGAGSERQYTAEQRELIAVDKRFQRAFVEKDIKAIDAILTDDYILVSSNGSQLTKADVLKDAASPESTWEVNETRDWEITVHGPVGIVVATLHEKGMDAGKPFDSNVRFSDIYVQENGHWRQLHAHASRAVTVK